MKYGAFLFSRPNFWGCIELPACLLGFCGKLGCSLRYADLPHNKRDRGTASCCTAVSSSFLALRDGHSSLCFLYEPCSRPSTGSSQNDTTQNIRRVMDTEVHPRECDENAYRQSRHRPLLFPGQPEGCHRGEGRRRMARREGEIVRVRDKQLYLREDVAWTDAGHQRLERSAAASTQPTRRVLRNTSSSAVSVTQRIPESPRRVIKPMLPSSMGLCRDCRAVRKVSSAFIKLPLSRFVVYRIPEVYEQKTTKS